MAALFGSMRTPTVAALGRAHAAAEGAWYRVRCPRDLTLKNDRNALWGMSGSGDVPGREARDLLVPLVRARNRGPPLNQRPTRTPTDRLGRHDVKPKAFGREVRAPLRTFLHLHSNST